MNTRMGSIIASLALVVFSGCATLPTGPSVQVLPGPGKTFEQFQADDAACRQWAGQQIGISPQETVNQNTATGAVVGTVLGAGLGAAIGAASGNPAIGAAIGAGSGLLVGTASGANAGNAYGMEAQRRYDNTYVQCMYAKGNQVPGAVRHYRRVRRAVPPPPPDLNTVPPDYVPGNAPPPPPPQ
jgi:outer membrane lipoprotein SlyB